MNVSNVKCYNQSLAYCYEALQDCELIIWINEDKTFYMVNDLFWDNDDFIRFFHDIDNELILNAQNECNMVDLINRIVITDNYGNTIIGIK